MMEKFKVCSRCGSCCYYVIPDKDGELVLKKCKHLIRNFHTRKTVCRIYNKRKMLRYQNGMVIDTYKDKEGKKQFVWCVWRSNAVYNHKGCPFNENGNQDFTDYCIKNNVRGR